MGKKISLEGYKERLNGRFTITGGEFQNNKSILTFKCEKCGRAFERRLDILLRNKSCPHCYRIDRYGFIWKSIQRNGYVYDYREVSYKDNQTPVVIICPKHGRFNAIPHNHYSRKEGGTCPLCDRRFKKHEKKLIRDNRFGTDNVIARVRERLGDGIEIIGYDGSKPYLNMMDRVACLCTIHDKPFSSSVRDLLNGSGCPLCGIEKSSNTRRLDVSEAIRIGKDTYNGFYDYSEIGYNGMSHNITPICPIHGKFNVNAYNHLFNHCGCPVCSRKYSQTERIIYDMVKEYYPDTIRSYHDKEILGRQEIDIYIPSRMVGIEVQGEQHFKPVNWFGGDESYNRIIERDLRKIRICEENGIRLIHFSFIKPPNDFSLYEVITDRNRLIETINIV